MMELLQLAQATTEAVTDSGIDWTGIAYVIGAIGSALAAVLGALGYKGKADKVKQLTGQAQAMVKGVEDAENGDTTKLADEFQKATGIELTPEQITAAQKVYNRHVKTKIKETALALNVEDLLKEFVERNTGKLSKEELQKRLKS